MLFRSAPGNTSSYTVSFWVKNTGKYPANEVVQLYLLDKVVSVTQPITRLIHFKPVSLAPNEARKVSFLITEEDLSMLDKDLNRVVEPGDFRIMIGRSCKDIRLKGTIRQQSKINLGTVFRSSQAKL